MYLHVFAMHDPHVSDKWPEWRETIKVSAIQAKPGFQAQGISGPQPAKEKTWKNWTSKRYEPLFKQ